MRLPVSQLDDVIHQRVRLCILTLLASRPRGSFTDLRSELDLTDGNLSVHLAVLERAGLVAIEKTYVARKPLTTATITPAGRTAFDAYLAALDAVVQKARSGRAADPPSAAA